jgi:hypothetical protein
MAKLLISTPFPSTAEVARKLGLPDSRIRRVAALMGLDGDSSNGSSRPRKKAAKQMAPKGN